MFVRRAKYNVVTFLPIFLFQQFTRFANLYFLFICAIEVRGVFGEAAANGSAAATRRHFPASSSADHPLHLHHWFVGGPLQGDTRSSSAPTLSDLDRVETPPPPFLCPLVGAEGIPTSALPLTFVIFFDGIITAIEDYRRHVDDRKTNQTRGECGDRAPRPWARDLSRPQPCSPDPPAFSPARSSRRAERRVRGRPVEGPASRRRDRAATPGNGPC